MRRIHEGTVLCVVDFSTIDPSVVVSLYIIRVIYYTRRIESVKGAGFGCLVWSTDVRNRPRAETLLRVVR